jgi:hypothetical protein
LLVKNVLVRSLAGLLMSGRCDNKRIGGGCMKTLQVIIEKVANGYLIHEVGLEGFASDGSAVTTTITTVSLSPQGVFAHIEKTLPAIVSKHDLGGEGV